MATRAPSQPVSRHYLTQAGLALALSKAIKGLWLDVNVTDPAALLLLRRRAAVLVNEFSRASATAAARSYTQERLAAGVRSGFTVPLAAKPDPEQVAKSLSWSTRNLQTLPPAAELPAVVEQAEQDMESAASRLVLNVGRQTTVEAVKADPKARAWAREARPDCCAFCAMLSSRGAVYKNEHTAGLVANERFKGDGQFKFHDNCHCQAVPVFGEYEPTAHARQWAADWEKLTDAKREAARKAGARPTALTLNEWRRHIEGRPTQDDPQLRG